MAVPQVTKVGKYEILDVLGRGGMGIVYKAVDPAIGRLVAIKMITGGFSDDPNLLKRFYREAQSTGTLQHPNIVTVYDLGDDGGVPYLVMEYLQGETLESVIRSRREILLAEKLSNIVLACDGLDYAHHRNIVHRDIKPANIILPNDGGLKIVDFGIARFGNERFTRTGQVMGSVYYMSPEQINGEESDAGTDIYSTGIVLFEFLTGQLPFRGKDTTSTLMKILRDPVPPLSTHLRAYPPELDEVLARALAKSRQDRYPTIEEFAFDLQRLQEGLRRDLVAGYLRSAEVCIERSEWIKAKENIRQIFKLDRQNTRANELGRVVQARIQKEQQREQIRQLRSRADEALRLRQWDDAIAYLDQAIEIEPSTEAIQWRDSVREKRSALDSALQKAESSHRAGDLEEAERAIEDALAVDPGDTQAKALKAIVSKELADRAKRHQLETLLAEAHREISAQSFTAALDLLQKAQIIDPTAAEVQQLAAFTSTAHQQQKRKRALESITAEIEECLNRDEFGAAVSKADEALAQFPNDPGISRLRAFAEKQRELWSRRIHVESQVTVAREMLEAGNASAAADVLKAALVRHPGDANLISLLSIVNEALSQEETRSQAEQKKIQEDQEVEEIVARARAVEARDLQTALSILESALQMHPNNAQLDVYSTVLRERVAYEKLQREQAEAKANRRREEIEAEINAARRLADANQPENALRLVTDALQKYPDTPDLDLYRRRLEAAIAEKKRQHELQLDAQKRSEIQAAVTNGRSLLQSGLAYEAKAVAQEALHKLGDVPALLALLSDATVALRIEAETSKEQEEPAEPASSPLPGPSATVLFGQGCRAPERVETVAYRSSPVPSGLGGSPPHSATAVATTATGRPFPQTKSQIEGTRGTKKKFIMAAVAAAVLLCVGLFFLVQPAPSSVHFDAMPSGTTISVDGKRCSSPCDLQLKPGTYKANASHEGYLPQERTLEVKARATNQETFTLMQVSVASAPIAPVISPPPASSQPVAPSKPSLPSRLLITGAAPGSDVLVDHQRVGRTDTHGAFASNVEPGEHQVYFVPKGSGQQTKYERFPSGGSVNIDATESRPAPSIQQQPSDAAEWLQVKNSQSPEPIEDFIRRYPNTQLKAQAQSRLEDIYWAKDTVNETAASLRDYLSRYPAGRYAQTAKGEMDRLDWEILANTADVAALQRFVAAHPSGVYHDRAFEKLDDLVWQQTDRRNSDSLRSYLQRFPSGKYTADANRDLSKLVNRPAPTVTASQPAAEQLRPTFVVDDRTQIKNLLQTYEKSYETEDEAALRKIWPSMGTRQLEGLETFFKNANSVKLTYIAGEPKISGNTATIEFKQEISYVMDGEFRKPIPARVLMKLKKSGGAWEIDSISGK